MIRHLAERDRPPILARMRRAWAETDCERAREQLTGLANELEHTHPGAAGSLREGLEETLTVVRLQINGRLKRTLESTNPCESMLDCVRTTQRNVKHWSSGDLELLVGQLSEPSFDEVQPGRAGRCEVQLEPWMGEQPALDDLGLVGGVVSRIRWTSSSAGTSGPRGCRRASVGGRACASGASLMATNAAVVCWRTVGSSRSSIREMVL